MRTAARRSPFAVRRSQNLIKGRTLYSTPPTNRAYHGASDVEVLAGAPRDADPVAARLQSPCSRAAKHPICSNLCQNCSHRMALTGLLRAAPRRSPFRCRSRAALRAGYLAPLDSTGTLRLLWPLTSACFKGSLRLTVAASLASLMLVVDAPRSCLDVRLPVSSLVRRLLQQRLRLELSQVDSLSLTLRAACGCLSRCCSAHRLPLSCTSALVSDPGGSPIAGLLTRCAHWSPLCQRRRQSTRKNFRGSIPRL